MLQIFYCAFLVFITKSKILIDFGYFEKILIKSTGNSCALYRILLPFALPSVTLLAVIIIQSYSLEVCLHIAANSSYK